MLGDVSKQVLKLQRLGNSEASQSENTFDTEN